MFQKKSVNVNIKLIMSILAVAPPPMTCVLEELCSTRSGVVSWGGGGGGGGGGGEGKEDHAVEWRKRK